MRDEWSSERCDREETGLLYAGDPSLSTVGSSNDGETENPTIGATAAETRIPLVGLISLVWLSIYPELSRVPKRKKYSVLFLNGNKQQEAGWKPEMQITSTTDVKMIAGRRLIIKESLRIEGVGIWETPDRT